jgi:hypothetical protein
MLRRLVIKRVTNREALHKLAHEEYWHRIGYVPIVNLLAHAAFHWHRIGYVPIVNHLVCEDTNATEDRKEA